MRIDSKDPDAIAHFIRDEAGHQDVTRIEVRLNQVAWVDGSQWQAGEVISKNGQRQPFIQPAYLASAHREDRLSRRAHADDNCYALNVNYYWCDNGNQTWESGPSIMKISAKFCEGFWSIKILIELPSLSFCAAKRT